MEENLPTELIVTDQPLESDLLVDTREGIGVRLCSDGLWRITATPEAYKALQQIGITRQMRLNTAYTTQQAATETARWAGDYIQLDRRLSPVVAAARQAAVEDPDAYDRVTRIVEENDKARLATQPVLKRGSAVGGQSKPNQVVSPPTEYQNEMSGAELIGYQRAREGLDPLPADRFTTPGGYQEHLAAYRRALITDAFIS